ncbi:HEAT repeat protein [Trichuris suis]|nr:HEAT repeat protein [Trichuris suis]
MEGQNPDEYWRAFFKFANSAGASDPVNTERSIPTTLSEEVRMATFAPLNASAFNGQDRTFMRDALAKFVKETDPIYRMKEMLEQLVNLSSHEMTPEEMDSAEENLYQLTEFCCFGDLAVDFCKIGGIRLLMHFVNHRNEPIKCQALQLVGELCQNNPYCQQALASAHFLPVLLKILSEDSAESVRLKALFALSSLTRGNEPVERLFCQLDGISKLVYQLSFPRLAVKACFMLANILDALPEYKAVACENQAMEMLLELCIEANDTTLQEQALNALLAVVSSCPEALKRAKENETSIRSKLDTILNQLNQDTDTADLVDVCVKIIHCCYPKEAKLNRFALKKNADMRRGLI